MRKYYNNIQRGNLLTFDPAFKLLYNSELKKVYINSLSNDVSHLDFEVHIYTSINDLIATVRNPNIIVDTESRNLLFDVENILELANIKSGSYQLIINSFLNIFGTFDSGIELLDVSTDRTEIKIPTNSNLLEYIINSRNSELLNQHVLNFGSNEVYNIVNFYADDQFIYFKLYQPLNDNIDVRSRCVFAYEIADPQIDQLTILYNITPESSRKLSPPNFNVDIDNITSNSTIYKSWEDLLSTDQLTSQNIIDKIFNTSEKVTLNIDYTNFSNFIFYSSALKRVEIFFEKIQIISDYNDKITALNLNGSYFELEQAKYQDFINKIRNSFDPFERWLYYNDGIDIFTHGKLGPVKPYPKTYVSGVLQLKAIDNSTVINWYNNLKLIAEEFDQTNYNSLQLSVPEHILMDENNSEYIMFVNMVSHHFDNIYLYINALTSIHDHDEHPERGAPNELLFEIAKSFGWNLQNTRVLSELWLYKDTKLKDGTDVLNISTHETQTYNVWKRIVNNLPYLYKTKGTTRSIEALMSIYGIPKTLISIKEYGGPGLDENNPMLIEDRFYYSMIFNQTRYLSIPQIPLLAGINEINPSDSDNLTNLLQNGNFTNGLTGWTIHDTVPSIETVDTINYIRFSGGEKSRLIQTIPTIIGAYYAIEFDIIENNESYPTLLEFFINSTEFVFPTTLSGKQTFYFIADATSTEFEMSLEVHAAGTFLIGNFNIYQEDEYFRYPDTYEFRFKLKEATPLIDTVLIRFDVGSNSGVFYGVVYNLKANNLYDIKYIGYNENYTIFEDIDLNNGQFWTIAMQKLKYHITSALDLVNTKFFIGCSTDYGYEKVTHFHTTDIDITGVFHTYSELNIILGGEFDIYDGFVGFINGYKEYYNRYSDDVFKMHVLNPNSYALENYTHVYNSLYRYLPLGLDVQRLAPASTLTISSSHPNQDRIVADSYGFGFSNTDEKLNYEYDVELFYINVPKIGGRTIQSQKIRIEESELLGVLSSNRRKEISLYDDATLDSNKLAIVFSLADQINRDIADHIGLSNLDKYIGDPDYEDKTNYWELENINQEYFKKYQQKNNINSFIKIFSVYDYTFFEQLKQLVPAKANLISGILIEPHLLERNKIQIAKKPIIENQFHEDTINLNIFNQYADIIFNETDININTLIELSINSIKGDLPIPTKILMLIQYIKANLRLNAIITAKFQRLETTIVRTFNLSGSNIELSSINSGIVQIRNWFYGVEGSFEECIDQYKKKCKYKKKTPIFSPYTNKTIYSKDIKNPSFTSVTGPLSRDFYNTDDLIGIDVYPLNNNHYFKSALGLSGSTTPSKLTINTEPVVGIKELEFVITSLNLDPMYSYQLELVGTSLGTETFLLKPTIYRNTDPIVIGFQRIKFTTLADTMPTINILFNSGGGTLLIFDVKIYDYVNDYQKNIQELFNRENSIVDYYILEDSEYQLQETSIDNNSIFNGSKLSGPDFNINSEFTIDKGPVVEFKDINPNILKATSSSGNLIVE